MWCGLWFVVVVVSLYNHVAVVGGVAGIVVVSEWYGRCAVFEFALCQFTGKT